MAEKNRRKKQGKGHWWLANVVAVILFVAVLAGAGVLGWQIYLKQSQIELTKAAREKAKEEHEAWLRSLPRPPDTIINDSTEATVRAAAKNGWIPCTGDCLKLATPGWRHLHLKGFSPSDYWFTYHFMKDNQSWSQYFSQRHAGHIIKEYGDSAPVDTGQCPVCHGTSWVRKDGESVQ